MLRNKQSLKYVLRPFNLPIIIGPSVGPLNLLRISSGLQIINTLILEIYQSTLGLAVNSNDSFLLFFENHPT